MRGADIIIAGTEKAGTTSVFSYLARHPAIAVSKRKETNFFRRPHPRFQDYAREFPTVEAGTLLLEASPAYLGEAALVAPRIHAMLPGVKLLFILRNPVDRFVSSFYFHRERLNLPQQLSLHEYLDRCLEHHRLHSSDEHRPSDARMASSVVPMDKWFLDVLPYGRYNDYLQHYAGIFSPEQLHVTFYDDLCSDPLTFMRDISAFLEIDADFWRSESFERLNASFAGRLKWLHRLAIRGNDRLEPLLRRRPGLKKALLSIYKTVNRSVTSDRTLDSGDRERLEDYYERANRDLAASLGTSLPASWTVGPQPSADEPAVAPAAKIGVSQ